MERNEKMCCIPFIYKMLNLRNGNKGRLCLYNISQKSYSIGMLITRIAQADFLSLGMDGTIPLLVVQLFAVTADSSRRGSMAPLNSH